MAEDNKWDTFASGLLPEHDQPYVPEPKEKKKDVYHKPESNLVPSQDFSKEWEDNEMIWEPGMTFDDTADIIIEYEHDNGDRTPILARGEVMSIYGPPKSRKTLLGSAMLTDNYIDDLSTSLGFRIHTNDDPILVIDTEQDKRRIKKNLDRFQRIIGKSERVPDIRTFYTKNMTYKKRLAFITYSIKKLIEETGKSPALILIDQIADLLPARDVNNQDAVNDVLEHLNKWDEMTGNNCAIICFIHTNRGGQNTNGKMGVIIDQKISAGFRVTLEENTWISTVEHTASREKRIGAFEFRQNMDGRPRLIGSKDHGSSNPVNHI